MTISSSTGQSYADRGRARRLRGRTLGCTIAIVLLCLLPTAPPFAEETASLDSLVWRYMDLPDAEGAHALLQKIAQDPRASISSVSSILKAGREYDTQDVGIQPSIPISVRGERYSYAIAVPSDYHPTAEYGLVLCLHGAGFTGEAYLERWQTRLGDRYILACPTYSMGAWWTRAAEELVLATLRDVASRYRIDPNRVFLTGMSNGGIGAWIIGMHHAGLFAGLAPMASGIDDVLYPFLANLKHTPVYVIHGAKDQVMPVELSRSVTEELKKLGYPVVYREHQREHPMAGGHYFPREELPELVAWLDRQRRAIVPTSLVVVRDASHLGPLDWIRIDATDRIASFTENLADGPDEFIKKKIYATIQATITGPNRIEVQTTHVRRYSVFLNDDLIDMSKPVVIITNGETSFEGLLPPSLETLLRQARLRRDSGRLFPLTLTVAVPAGPS